MVGALQSEVFAVRVVLVPDPLSPEYFGLFLIVLLLNVSFYIILPSIFLFAIRYERTICAKINYFPVGKKPNEKAGTIICVNALYETNKFNFSIIVPPFIRIYFYIFVIFLFLISRVFVQILSKNALS